METKSNVESANISQAKESKLTYEQIEKDRVQLVSKIEELYQDVVEHKLVLEALESVPSDRRCYRMVGEVLVERTVGEIKPALLDHKNKVEQIIAECQKQLDQKNNEISNFIKSAKAGNLPSGMMNSNPSVDTNNLNDKEKKSDSIIF
ncbi:putative prefoldin subunit 2 [Plasmodium gaboni]|uniref:Prefoldin subunit 2, putative n=1 Tax=Plasmodium gaboni TaxID=647221 RepID=A0A151L9Z8_9APIC|nr:putative prefoldin subunit 2 [Plasmodium gaboni]KYN95780.1 putative prefoldin subunit 2 [Plasmodium gaboni]SOV18804.1 prefoldin subunit 2, putative [Plasmodium gaboni]